MPRDATGYDTTWNSMRTSPDAYRPPTLTFGRFQSRNDTVTRPPATPSRHSGLNCIAPDATTDIVAVMHGTTAAEEAVEMVAAVRDDPRDRLALAARFYDRRIDSTSIRSYRRAEIAFMRWQIRRGVLDPPDATRPGSPWWRALNEGLLADAWQADRLVNGSRGEPTRPSVEHWISFLRQPSGPSWYRAHNASIVAGYLAHRDLVDTEHPLERFFMDVALIRVLFAECLLVAPRLVVRSFAIPGRLLADPRWRGANVFLSLRNILPDVYPLDGLTVQQILDDENYVGRLIDYAVILPRLDAVYERAAASLDAPELLDMIRHGSPVYAWPYEERHVWTATKARSTIHTVQKLTWNSGPPLQ